MSHRDYNARLLMLFFRLNQQTMLYTPLSRRAQRATRIMANISRRLWK